MRKLYSGTPVGARDVLWDDCDRIRALEGALVDKFKSAGFREIRTPLFEYYDLFLKTGLPIPQEAMHKVTDRSGRILVCRPDSTTPAARVAATRLGMRPLKLFYIQPVYRADDAHTGRGIQTLQAGVEWIGTEAAEADAPMLRLARESLSALNAGEFKLEIGHAGLFGELTRDMDRAERIADDMRELIGRKSFAAAKDLIEAHFDSRTAARCLSIISMYGGAKELAEAGALLPGSRAVEELAALYHALDGNVSIDFGLVGDMDYYTGLIFRGYVSGAADAVLTGGRYDRLMSGFGRDEPAVGFAINLDAALGALSKSERGVE